jgi:hypothetical protein
VSLILFGGTVFDSLTRQDTQQLVEMMTFPALFLGIVALAAYLVTLIRSLVLASETIAREQRAGTWETLLLTGVDAERIVRGKWWATVRHIWPSFLLAGLLRLGVVAWVGLFFAMDAWRIWPDYYPEPSLMLFSSALVIALSIVNAGLAAACGVLASLMSRRSGTGLILAIVIYAGVLAATLVVFGLAAHFLNWRLYLLSSVYANDYARPSWQIYNVLTSVGVTMVDQGAILATTLLQYQTLDSAPTYYCAMNALVGGFLALLIYPALIWGVLRLAQMLAVQQGALPTLRGYHKNIA